MEQRRSRSSKKEGSCSRREVGMLARQKQQMLDVRDVRCL
jgi:hypothetical protein